MRRHYGEVLIWLLALCVLCGTAQAADLRQDFTLSNRILTLFSGEKGLPSNEANVVLQTRDGYLWVGGYGGLLRYDGWSFLNLSQQKNNLPSFSIRTLHEDAAGRLWIGTNNMGAFVFDNGVFTPCAAGSPDLFQAVRCFAEDAAGTLYVGTTTGLAVAKDGKLLAVPQLENQLILSLSVDRNGALWGATMSGMVFCLRNGELLYNFEPDALTPHGVSSVFADGPYVYIGTGANLVVRLAFHDAAYTPGSYRTEVIDTGNIQSINTLFRSAEGELWIGGDSGYGWFDTTMTLHTLETAEKVGSVHSIAQDCEGNLWMASSRSGLYRVASGKFYNANAKAGLEGLTVNAVARLGGLLYVGTDSGLNIVDTNWNPIKNALTALLEDVRIRNVLADSRGNLWICTFSDMGLVRYTPSTGKVLSLTEKEGLCSNRVRAVQELANGDLAVGTNGGFNIVRNAAVTASYGPAQGVTHMVLSLLELTDGTLLAGSDGQGIYALRDGKVRVIGKENGLSIGTVLRMREDLKANGVWVAGGELLFFMDREFQLRPITTFRHGPASLFDILVDDDALWLMKSDGVRRVSRKTLLQAGELDVSEFGARRGLLASLVVNSWNMYDDGLLYLCTTSGLAILPLSKQTLSTAPPRTAVNAVLFSRGESGEEEHILRPQRVVLPKDTRRMTIEFASLSFGLVPSNIEYALQGFDPQPIRRPAGDTNVVSYTNLPGGDYVFRLKAVNADGVESAQVTTLPIHKELNYYEYPAFWEVLALTVMSLVGLGGYMVVRVKTRNLKRRQQEYKDITEQALRTIANTIDAKDSYTNGHSIRVGEYSREIARRLGLDAAEQERIYYIGLLHDIGKIGIPDAILNKPGKLTKEEFDIMRRHTLIGEEILKNFSAVSGIDQGALNHHERFSGQGYPHGTAGTRIPFIARIIAAADAYDAMATRRVYRDVIDVDTIIAEFENDHGNLFDPEIAAIMVGMIKEQQTS